MLSDDFGENEDFGGDLQIYHTEEASLEHRNK